MNERMLDLALQTGLKKDHASDREYVGDFDWRLFAELIVQDCVSEIALMGVVNFEDENISWCCSQLTHSIKTKFGLTQ